MNLRALVVAAVLCGCIPDSDAPEVAAPYVAACSPKPCRAEVVATDQGNVWGVVADAQDVYWTGGSPLRLRRCATAGGAVDDLTSGMEAWPYLLVLDEGRLTWTTQSPETGELWTKSLAPESPDVRLGVSGYPSALAATGGAVYYATPGGI